MKQLTVTDDGNVITEDINSFNIYPHNLFCFASALILIGFIIRSNPASFSSITDKRDILSTPTCLGNLMTATNPCIVISFTMLNLTVESVGKTGNRQ